MSKKVFLVVALISALLVAAGGAYAATDTKDLTIVFTGQSFAALYPCNCINTEGGVARRASAIRKIRSSFQNVIVLEAGSSFPCSKEAAGEKDPLLLRKQAGIYLDALRLMDYDALLADNCAFSFGRALVKQHSSLPFVSDERSFGKPFIIKDFKGWKVGVIGVRDLARKMMGLQKDMAAFVQQQVDVLKSKGVETIILLSGQDPEKDDELLKRVKGIDIVINGSFFLGTVKAYELSGALFVQTWWESRNLGVLSVQIDKGRVTKSRMLYTPLNEKIQDDPQVAKILPSCIFGSDCRSMHGLAASCVNPGTEKSRCQYLQLPKVSMTVIIPSGCVTCKPQDVVEALKEKWGKIEVTQLWEGDPGAQKFIKDFKLNMLPAYIFHKDIEASEYFPSFKENLEENNGYYLVKQGVAGVSYIIGRKKLPKRLDVFYDMRYPRLRELFELLKEFSKKHRDIKVELHFLAVSNKEMGILTLGGPSFIDEFKRVACAGRFYPRKVFDYVICRTMQNDASSWGDCASEAGMNVSKVRSCSLSQEGEKLLRERIKLTEELEIASGPTFLIDNVEIFAIVNVPTLKEFEVTVLGKDFTERKQQRPAASGRDQAA